MHEAFGAIKSYILGPTPEVRQRITDSEADFERFAKMFRETSSSPDERKFLGVIKIKFSEAVTIGNEIIALTDQLNKNLETFERVLSEMDRLLDNTDRSYKRLGSIISDARLAGLVDWSAIEDRTRFLRGITEWDSPADTVRAAARDYRVDYWKGQKIRPEVWIEKDALVGVIENVCKELDVDFFSCRGYVSQSEIWNAGRRILRRRRRQGQATLILHLGDHDPSGIDMTRDIRERVGLFAEQPNLPVARLALNMDQVQQYNPPPNPAKLSDARAAGYVAEYGGESWELDALNPSVMEGLIRDAVDEVLDSNSGDRQLWEERHEDEDREQADLLEMAENYSS